MQLKTGHVYMRGEEKSKNGHWKCDIQGRMITGNRNNAHATPGNEKLATYCWILFRAWRLEFSSMERECVEQKN